MAVLDDQPGSRPADQLRAEPGVRQETLKSQLLLARLLLVGGGLGACVMAIVHVPPPAFLLLGGFLLLSSYVIALRWRVLSRRVSATTRQLEGFPPRLKVCLDAVAEPLIVIDGRALVVFANLAAKRSLPNCKENNPLSFAIRAPRILSAVEEVLRGDAPLTVDYEERVPVERHFEVTVSPIWRDKEFASDRSGAGAPRESIVMLMRDVTQMQRIQNMRVDFIANASHELRTPLASVIGFIETLQGPAKNDVSARERFLGIMGEQARRMSRLVDDLLSLSRIELTQHVAPEARVDLVLVLRQIIDTLSGLARERAVEIRLEPPDAKPTFVQGERDELLRVFENLIENAIKYGQAGKVVIVSLTPRFEVPDAGEIDVAVRDFGPGIPPEHVPRLTERFYRVDIGKSVGQGGTGLGLAIVKHILNRHRGRLNIQSRLGEGSVFTVTLPLLD